MNKFRTPKKEDLARHAVLQELKENPYRSFHIAFALMTVIPFLAFFYVLLNNSDSFNLVVGQNGGILFISILIALCGFSIGYLLIGNILRRLVLYATKLKRSDQLKSTVVASVAHELKNPLAIIKTNLSNMLEGLAGTLTDAQRSILDLSARVADRIISLINDLLDLHKLEAGLVEMKREYCDLSKIVESQVGEFEPIVSKKGISIAADTIEKNLMLWADTGKLAQVVNNLLSNAIKYSSDGSSVGLKAYPVEHFIRLEVSDKGPGIPADKIDKIFDKFERLDRSKEGTGLGLSITKDIVEMHKGRIWAESAVGKGSTFVVVLPRDLRRVMRAA